MRTFETLDKAREVSIDISLVVYNSTTFIRVNDDKTFTIVDKWCNKCVCYTENGTCTDHVSNTAP